MSWQIWANADATTNDLYATRYSRLSPNAFAQRTGNNIYAQIHYVAVFMGTATVSPTKPTA
ncbi:hypothetical protein KCP78_18565 [Salmonella enterica subsp. enterica]|nr:hypothetical protein KCP78_18565 [Salmonella enterica subsp. enterica]